MLTIHDIACKSREFQLPSHDEMPPMSGPDFERYSNLLEHDLVAHAARLDFDIRVAQAETLGFQRLLPTEIGFLLTGVKTETDPWRIPANPEYFLDHRDRGSKLRPPYIETHQMAGYQHNWFSEVRKTSRIDAIDLLACEIPESFLANLKKWQELQFFNCFFAAAVEESWSKRRNSTVSPILLACIAEFWRLPSAGTWSTGRIAYYFMERW